MKPIATYFRRLAKAHNYIEGAPGLTILARFDTISKQVYSFKIHFNLVTGMGRISR
jgi:hypothetical protein